jgi:hypothetical protein
MKTIKNNCFSLKDFVIIIGPSEKNFDEKEACRAWAQFTPMKSRSNSQQ